MPPAFAQRFEETAMPRFEENFGVTVYLVAGAKQTDEFTAISNAREDSSIEFETGLPIKIAYRDWLLPVSSLLADGEAITPRAGCRIVEGDEEFEIVPIDKRPAVELVEGGYRYFCHSQRITT